MVKVIFIFIFLGTVNLFANQINQYKIWVIRHGQRAKITAPAYDPPLTKLGVKQAEKAALFLKKHNFNGKIYASPYRRTLETASIIAKHLNKKFTLLHLFKNLFVFQGFILLNIDH